MDRVVQQNAANAEESAAAAQQMSAQAEQMKVYVKDLVSLVGTTTDNRNGNGEVRTMSKRLRQLAARNQAQNAPMIAGAGASSWQNPASPGKQGQIPPEKVIPLEEAHLKEF